MNRGPRVVGHRKFLGKTLRKIIKIVATRWRIIRLKCTKFDFGWGSAPDPAGELTALPRPRSRGRGCAGEERERGEREGGGVEEREREGPKLLLNQGPSEPCYATGIRHSLVGWCYRLSTRGEENRTESATTFSDHNQPPPNDR